MAKKFCEKCNQEIAEEIADSLKGSKLYRVEVEIEFEQGPREMWEVVQGGTNFYIACGGRALAYANKDISTKPFEAALEVMFDRIRKVVLRSI